MEEEEGVEKRERNIVGRRKLTGLDLYGPSPLPRPLPPSFAAEPCASAASPSPYSEAWSPLWASGTAASVTGAEALPMATSTCWFFPPPAAEQIDKGRRAAGVGARCWDKQQLRAAKEAAGIGVEWERKKKVLRRLGK